MQKVSTDCFQWLGRMSRWIGSQRTVLSTTSYLYIEHNSITHSLVQQLQQQAQRYYYRSPWPYKL